jgi:hypothetical protein
MCSYTHAINEGWGSTAERSSRVNRRGYGEYWTAPDGCCVIRIHRIAVVAAKHSNVFMMSRLKEL